MRIKITTIAVFILLLGSAVLSVAWYIGKLRFENQRLANNNRVLNTGVNELLLQDSLKAITIGQLQLEKKEIRLYYDEEVMENLQVMNRRLRNLESFTAVNTETTYRVHTQFKDTLVRDTVKLEALKYRSEWFDIDVIKSGSEAKINAVSRDSLLQIVTWERANKFLFFRHGRKRYEQTIRSANPNSRITYAKYIVPVKKRRG
jgi:hypothetical protein